MLTPSTAAGPAGGLADRLSGVMAVPTSSHDEAVKARINRYLRKVNREHPQWTQAQKLEQAWSENIEERTTNSTDPVGRDADYYLAARKELASSSNKPAKVGKGLLGQAAWVVYAGLKVGSEAVGHPEWLRTDPDKPNAPVGGYGWMNKGIDDGYDDQGDKVSDVKLYDEPANDADSNKPSSSASSGSVSAKTKSKASVTSPADPNAISASDSDQCDSEFDGSSCVKSMGHPPPHQGVLGNTW